MRTYKYINLLIGSMLLLSIAYSQSALFLLIAPGARAGGMGEAQVAVANDSYATYWNPAGLGFQEGYELSGMHVNWLPGLVDDMYYDFIAGIAPVENLGVFGAHIIYLNAGEQTYTDANGVDLGTFLTYFTSGAISYSTLITENSSIGFNFKILYQHLTDSFVHVEEEKTKGTATNFGFDVGYLSKGYFGGRLDIGAMVSNLGPKVIFNDEEQADPMPTNLKLGINMKVYESSFNRLNIVYDVNKLLVGEYAAMDWDEDGFIGGYDNSGAVYESGDYNADGQKEIAHTDSWWKGIFTSFLDDWYLGGDRDMDGDRIIGGWNADTVATVGGVYGSGGDLEIGNSDGRSITNEFSSLIHSFGLEYWYNDMFAIRAGYYYDTEGKITTPTVGAGPRYSNYGVDFGYTVAEETHPLNNTMRFSLLLKF
ncbi:MAG: PorV/PorQ family protein [Candidatus Marinimicrobia bacterium]|nr:PorV/PorQ family protein [Candidatus Neomarinimicrobiota bacterium]